MLPADLERYCAEIARVTKPGGRSFITYFLLTPESRRLMDEKRSSLDFSHALDGCWTTDPAAPEAALAYPEETVRQLYRRHGITVEAVRFGSWCGRSGGTTYQDIVLGSKDL